MTFSSTSKIGSGLQKVTDDRASDKAAISGGKNTRVCLTQVDKRHAGLATTSLAEMVADKSSTNTFRTSFYVAKVEGGAGQGYNKGTKKWGGKGDHVRMQFLCKDASTQHNSNLYRVLLYTHEGLGSNFFGKNKANTGMLTRFNSWVDAVVERRNGYFFIKDTQFVF